MSFPAEGGCLCGAVRYRVSAAPLTSMHCHCVNCRKASGAAVLTWFTVAADVVEWRGERPRTYRYESVHYPRGVERLFCGACGSQLAWRLADGDTADGDTADGDTIDLTVGSLDDPQVIEPEAHVFMRSRVHWMPADENLPAFETTSRADA